MFTSPANGPPESSAVSVVNQLTARLKAVPFQSRSNGTTAGQSPTTITDDHSSGATALRQNHRCTMIQIVSPASNPLSLRVSNLQPTLQVFGISRALCSESLWPKFHRREDWTSRCFTNARIPPARRLSFLCAKASCFWRKLFLLISARFSMATGGSSADVNISGFAMTARLNSRYVSTPTSAC